MDLPNPKLFFPQKSLAEQNDIKKSSEHNKYFHWKKMHRFLNVLTTFYKDIKRPVKRSERSDYENKKIHHIYSKI